MKPRKIFWAIPSRDDAIMGGTFNCFFDECLEMLCNGWAPSIQTYGGINPIHTVRNRAVAEFMESDCDDLVFADDDVVWQRGTLIKLLNYDVEMVGVATPHKQITPSFPVRTLPGVMKVDERGLMKVDGLPFGLVRLSRSCVEKMVKAYADLHYHSPQVPTTGAWRLFSFDMVDGQDRSEDFMFCKRWQDIGGTVWCAPDVHIVHIGKYAYNGNFDQYLKAHPSLSKLYEPGVSAA